MPLVTRSIVVEIYNYKDVLLYIKSPDSKLVPAAFAYMTEPYDYRAVVEHWPSNGRPFEGQ